MIIRHIDYHDLPQYLELLRHISNPVSLNSAKIIFSLSLSMSSTIHVYVAEEDGKIVGAATMNIEPKFTKGITSGKDTGRSRVAHIEDVVVLPEYREKGVASKLIKHIVDCANREPCRKVVLSCNEELVSFYKKNGFTKSGVTMEMKL